MANTWRVQAEQVTPAAGKDLLDIFNNSGSRVYRVYRMLAFNNTVTSGTGVLGYLNVYRITAASSGTTLTSSIIPHDSTNSDLDANLSAGTGRTVTISSLFRRVPWSPDEAALRTVDWDSVLTIVSFAEVWSSGYGSVSAIEPLTMRSGQAEGYSLYSTVMTAVAVDCEIEFTDSSS